MTIGIIFIKASTITFTFKLESLLAFCSAVKLLLTVNIISPEFQKTVFFFNFAQK